jgi:hypothetical protein
VGYSIAIRARNPKLGKRMAEFMSKNFRSWSEVTGVEGGGSSHFAGNDLSYDSDSKAVGFDYASHCHGWESCLIYSETRWMAIKVGSRKSRFSRDAVTPSTFKEPVPFMVYDGHQSWPILIVKNLKEAMALPEGCQWCSTDELGVYVGPEVNEILTSYAERAPRSKKERDAYWKDMEKIKKLHTSNFEAWYKKYVKIRVKYARPEIAKMLPLVRAEVARLDALWSAGS